MVTESLARELIRLKFENKDCSQAERLLRRMTGNVTEFIKAVGIRPEKLDSFDRATIAVHDGDIEEFRRLLPETPHRYTSLLTDAAARPDGVGSQMTGMVLAVSENIPNDTYVNICKKAMKNDDIDKLLMLMDRAEFVVQDLNNSFYSNLIIDAILNMSRKMTLSLTDACPDGSLEESGSNALRYAIEHNEYKLSRRILEKGVDLGNNFAELFYTAARKEAGEYIHLLKEKGADIDGQNSFALRICLGSGNLNAAKFLLDNGADFEKFRNNTETQTENSRNFVAALQGYWETEIKPQDRPEQDNGMTFR